MKKPRYPFFGVAGIEIEYVVVDENLVPRNDVDLVFREASGRWATDVELGEAVFTNELAAHVMELKLDRPAADLAGAEKALFAGLEKFQRMMRDRLGLGLLPTGMHPFMKPTDSRLWNRAGRGIYETYARLFDIRQHGWLNVQSIHVNLPFGETERETAAMHNALAMLIPYFPALTASSPLVEGRLGPAVDNRLAAYRKNQAAMPEISGRVVPEYMTTYREYKARIFEPIYAKLRKLEGGAGLCKEWVNSRGAIVRFMRNAVELRVLDSQECVKMDVAVGAFARAVTKALTMELLSGGLTLPPHDVLVEDYARTVARGRAAKVRAPHLRSGGGRGGLSPAQVLLDLMPLAAAHTPPREKHYLSLVEARLRGGNLSELIAAEFRARAGRSPRDRYAAIVDIYRELQSALETNTPWKMTC